MYLLNRAEVRALIDERAKKCVSVYLPTHRSGSEIQQDPIRFKNLLKQAEERLANGEMRRPEAQAILQPAQRLLDDGVFWRHQSDGLAVFASPDTFRCYRLPYSFSELVVVTERFHVKPLLTLLSGDGRFYILAISQKQVRLLLGTRHSVFEVNVENLPKSLADALGVEEREKQLQFHTAVPGSSPIFHGHGGGTDETVHKKDLLRYFKQIDKALKDFVAVERTPLVLAAVDYLHPIYREANTAVELIDEGIVGNPDGLSRTELHDRAWTLLEPYFAKAQERAAARFLDLAGTDKASGDLGEIVPAAHHGRVESLFVAVGVQQWGRYDSATGTVETHESHESGDQDLLDLAAVETLAHAGDVYAVGPDKVPGSETASPVAAVFRY
jgi:hypothetical protein